jgi:hypothetical protein
MCFRQTEYFSAKSILVSKPQKLPHKRLFFAQPPTQRGNSFFQKMLRNAPKIHNLPKKRDEKNITYDALRAFFRCDYFCAEEK